jgi:putative ABC transport system permease protein
VVNILFQWLRRLRFYLRRDRFDRELGEEMKFHLELKEEDNLRAGMNPSEARAAARRQFGNQTLLQEVSREMWAMRSIETFLQDLRYGGRMMLKRPGFTFVVILTLALGIGANTAIFSVVNGVLLRALPFNNPERIISLWATDARRGQNRRGVSYPNFDDWRAQQTVFEYVAAHDGTSATLTGYGTPEQLRGLRVSADLFPLLGTPALHGRWFSASEEQTNDATAVIISEGLWERRFGADPDIVGRLITLNSQGVVIIGVMPSSFNFPLDEEYPTEYWGLLKPDRERGHNHLNVVGRLKPGLTIAQAQAEMDAVAGRLTAQYPNFNTGRGIRLIGMQEDLTRNVRRALLVLLVSVGCVLLIACANVANLLLARVTGRHKEIAVRLALGATRGRVIRQLLVESLLLAMLSGGAGALLAVWGVASLRPLIPRDVPLVHSITLDLRVLGVTLGLSILTGILFGLIPALQAGKTNLTDALKEDARGLTGSPQRNRTRSALIIIEVALSLMLAVGAGLLIRSFWQLLNVNPGFNPEGVTALHFSLPGARYGKNEQQTGFYKQLIGRVKALPGVVSVSVVDPLPLSGGSSSSSIVIEGQPPLALTERPKPLLRFVGPDYLQTLGTPLLKGRTLDDGDHLAAPKVMLVNETFARRYLPHDDPLGKRVSIGIGDNFTCQIVGVVGDVRTRSLDVEAEPECYFSYQQNPFSELTLIVRTAAIDATDIVPAVRSEVAQIDAELAISDIRTMSQLVAATVAPQRFNLLMLVLFAGVSILLAVIGIYSVMAYAVSQRRHEIGLRFALGAQPSDVMKLVVGQGMRLTLIGVAVGLAGAYALTRLMSSLLYGVSATDPMTFIVVSSVLCAAALAACYVPAQRAAKIDPMVALRSE